MVHLHSFLTSGLNWHERLISQAVRFTPEIQSRYKGKVNFTLIQSLRICTGRNALRGSRGIALPFLDHGARRGLGISVTTRPLFTPGKDPVPNSQEAGWAPGPVLTG